MNLTLVCRSWRSFVAECPGLWSRLWIEIEYGPPLHQGIVQLTETWLRNSSPSPLDVSIKLSTTDTSSDTILEKIASMILLEANRWRNVVFYFSFASLKSFRREIRLPSSPSLKSLYIGVRGWNTNKDVVVALDLSQSRHLRTLSLGLHVKLRLLEQYPVRLDSLSRLTVRVDASTLEALRRILKATTNIRYLHVDFGGRSPPIQRAYSDGSIRLANLLELTLVDENRVLHIHFLGWIECPKLVNFIAQGPYSHETPRPFVDYDITSGLLHALDDFFCRSHPPLIRLDLNWLRRDPSGDIPVSLHEECSMMLIQILVKLDKLKILELRGFVADDRLFQAMTSGEGEETYSCPSLRYLEVETFFHNVTLQVQEDFIISRRRESGTDFYRLVLGFWRHKWYGSFWEELWHNPAVEQCRREGLSLRC